MIKNMKNTFFIIIQVLVILSFIYNPIELAASESLKVKQIAKYTDTGGFVNDVVVSKDENIVGAATQNGEFPLPNLSLREYVSPKINGINISASSIIISEEGDAIAFRYSDGRKIGVFGFDHTSQWAGKVDYQYLTEIESAYDMDATPDLSTIAVVTRPPETPGNLYIIKGKNKTKYNIGKGVGITVSVSRSGKYIAVAQGQHFKITEALKVKRWGFKGVSLYNQDGKLLWRYETKENALTIKILEKQDIIIVGDDGGTLTVLSLKEGQKKWCGEYGAWFAVNNKYLLARNEKHNIAMFLIDSGKVIWESDKYVADYIWCESLSVSNGGIAIVGTGMYPNFKAIVFDASGKVIWKKNYKDGPLVAISDSGNTWAVGTKQIEVYRKNLK